MKAESSNVTSAVVWRLQRRLPRIAAAWASISQASGLRTFCFPFFLLAAMVHVNLKCLEINDQQCFSSIETTVKPLKCTRIFILFSVSSYLKLYIQISEMIWKLFWAPKLRPVFKWYIFNNYIRLKYFIA